MTKIIKKTVCVVLLVSLTLVGCTSKEDKKDSTLVSTTNAKLIYEETVSPNKEYVTSEEDEVKYEIKIFQNKENKIIVIADSNSELFEKLHYELDYDSKISETNINIKWTTLMGNPEATKEDQLAVANVSISANGEVFSERKINFMKKVIDIITDTVNKNK